LEATRLILFFCEDILLERNNVFCITSSLIIVLNWFNFVQKVNIAQYNLYWVNNQFWSLLDLGQINPTLSKSKSLKKHSMQMLQIWISNPDSSPAHFFNRTQLDVGSRKTKVLKVLRGNYFQILLTTKYVRRSVTIVSKMYNKFFSKSAKKNFRAYFESLTQKHTHPCIFLVTLL
jgi:hypothetical protein